MKPNRKVILPPFSWAPFTVKRQDIADLALFNPHPTDILLDTSVFAMDRTALVREILIGSSPILLGPVRVELEDLKTKSHLVELRDLVFPDGSLNSRFRGDDCGVLTKYLRVATRYASLLRWRRDAIDIQVRHATRESGVVPTGKRRANLIRTMLKEGIAQSTIELANKGYRPERNADEALAVFAVLSPIVTGRDCFLLTADKDVVQQARELCMLLFEDYGAYLMAIDFRNNECRYQHRHSHDSNFVDGEAIAIGRSANPDYLLPPPALIKTCATHVLDVSHLTGFTWISVRNMERAIAFQERDPLGRKGDPGMERGIIFSLPDDLEKSHKCKEKHHFVVGALSSLKLVGDHVGPVALFDLARVLASTTIAPPRRSTRIISPFTGH